MLISEFHVDAAEQLQFALNVLNKTLFSKRTAHKTYDEVVSLMAMLAQKGDPYAVDADYVRTYLKEMITWLAEVSHRVPFYFPNNEVFSLYIAFARAVRMSEVETPFTANESVVFKPLSKDIVDSPLLKMHFVLSDLLLGADGDNLNVEHSLQYYHYAINPLSFYDDMTMSIFLKDKVPVLQQDRGVAERLGFCDPTSNYYLLFSALVLLAYADNRANEAFESYRTGSDKEVLWYLFYERNPVLKRYLLEFYQKLAYVPETDWPFHLKPTEIYSRYESLLNQ